MDALSFDEVAILAVKSYTLSNYARLRAMADAVLHIDRAGVSGAVVECGVWRGGNIMLARLLSPKRMCWLYDTFQGMTEPGPEDKRRSGAAALDDYKVRAAQGKPWCAASLDEVIAGMRQTGTYDPTLCKFIVGDVIETLRDGVAPNRIALLRLDTDWFASTKEELETLYPRLAPGGVLIVDDYGHWQGARKAVDEYFAGSDVSLKFVDYSCVTMVKP